MDRNTNFFPAGLFDLASLSARRAWIEIAIVSIVIFCIMGSLSARRAWIEINGLADAPPHEHSRSPQGERG